MKPLRLCLVAFVVAACAAATTWREIPSTPPQLLRYVADYYALHDTLYVRENENRLEGVLKRVPHTLAPVVGDTFSFDNEKLVLGRDTLHLAGATFIRRAHAAGTFRITPLHSAEELRPIALAARPPAQPDSLLQPDLVELKSLDPTIKYDIRYASTNNFIGAQFYSSPHAFMQRPAAEAVARANRKLKPLGFGLLIHDAYRPWYVTKMFWDATPDSLKEFVANPYPGSRHNRGCAVDLTMYDLRTGQPVEMTGGYDEFSERSYPTYPGGTTRQRRHRELLRSTMESAGFTVYESEWWHFDYRDWRRYPVTNFTFEQLLK